MDTEIFLFKKNNYVGLYVKFVNIFMIRTSIKVNSKDHLNQKMVFIIDLRNTVSLSALSVTVIL